METCPPLHWLKFTALLSSVLAVSAFSFSGLVFFPLPPPFLPPHNPAFRLPLAICIFLLSQMWHFPWKSCMFCFKFWQQSRIYSILLSEAPASHGHQDFSKFYFAASTQAKSCIKRKQQKL